MRCPQPIALATALLALPLAMSFHPLQPSSPLRVSTPLHASEPEKIFRFEGTQPRRALLAAAAATSLSSLFHPNPAHAAATSSTSKRSCTDIDSCRELGEQKDIANQKANPVTRLSGGVRYKVLQQGVGGAENSVRDGSSIDLIFTLSTGGGQYMYSQGFGYEMVPFGKDGKLVKDIGGLDSIRVTVGKRQVPVGIEQALKGMKRGERRRVELPPEVGLETSNWAPVPKTPAGKRSVEVYQRTLSGFGSQPAFAAPTIWDIEVLRIKN